MKAELISFFLLISIALTSALAVCVEFSVVHAVDPLQVVMDHEMEGMDQSSKARTDHLELFWNIVPGVGTPFDLLSLFVFVVFSLWVVRVCAGACLIERAKKFFLRWLYFYHPPGLAFAFQKGIVHPKRF